MTTRGDWHYTARKVLRSPVFAGVTILTTGLAVGALATASSVAHGVLIRDLPYPDPGQIVVLSHGSVSTGAEFGVSPPIAEAYSEAQGVVALSVYDQTVLNFTGEADQAQKVLVATVTPGIWDVLGIEPDLGRRFTEEDARPGFMDIRWPIPVALSHRFWQTQFGGDTTIVGREIRLNEMPRIVVAILPDDVRFPSRETDLWMLHVPDPERTPLLPLNMSAVARLQPDRTASRFEAELDVIYANRFADAVSAAQLTGSNVEPRVTPLKESLVAEARTWLLLLFGGAVFLVLVATANLGNLFIARGIERSKELALRVALGQTARGAAGVLVREGLLIGIAGVSVGFLLSWIAVYESGLRSSAYIPRAAGIGLSWQVFGIVSILMLLIISGVIRAAVAASGDQHNPAGALRTTSASRSKRAHRASKILVGSQIALATALVLGSALLARSVWELTSVDPGFVGTNRLTVEVGLPWSRAPQYKQAYTDLVRQVEAVGGVEEASLVSAFPLTEQVQSHRYPVRAANSPTGPTVSDVALRFFLPGYLEVMGIDSPDKATRAQAPTGSHARGVYISEALAQRLFGANDPVGRQVHRLSGDAEVISGHPPYEVAGVVKDVREESLREGGTPTIYVPINEHVIERSILPTEATIVVRSEAEAEIALEIRAAIAEYDRSISVSTIQRVDDLLASTFAATSSLMALLLAAAGVAAVLGLVGVYGVATNAARRRSSEMALRVAIGATPKEIFRLILGEAGLMAIVGVSFGLILAAAGSRALASLLFGVQPIDPGIWGLVGLTMGVVSIAATLIPALRASRTPPFEVLQGSST